MGQNGEQHLMVVKNGGMVAVCLQFSHGRKVVLDSAVLDEQWHFNLFSGNISMIILYNYCNPALNVG